MKDVTPNARLWTVVNLDIVKLTLKPGRTLNWSRATRDDEGFSLHWVRWTHEGSRVRYEDGFDGRDAHYSKISRYDAFTAEIERLKAGPVDQETGVPLPDWIRACASQRDNVLKAGWPRP